MDRRLWTRIVFAYLTFQSLQIGLWALLAPQSFYDGFPGLGRTWIAVDGPFNEHLIRDVGALNLALAALFIAAAVIRDRTLTVVGAVAALVWGIPHLIYHIVNREGLTNSDLALSLGGLAIFVVLPLTVLAFLPDEPSTERG